MLSGQWRPSIFVQFWLFAALCCGTNSPVLFQMSGTLSLAAMESFIQKQEKLLESLISKAPEGEGSRESSMQEDIDRLGMSEQETHPDTDSGELSLSVSAVQLLHK